MKAGGGSWPLTGHLYAGDLEGREDGKGGGYIKELFDLKKELLPKNNRFK